MHKSLSTAPLKKLLFAVASPKKALRVEFPEELSALTNRKLGALVDPNPLYSSVLFEKLGS